MSHLRFLLPGLVLALPCTALAVDEVYSPNAEKGELAVEYSGNRTFDDHHGKNAIIGHEIELEYGLTDRLMVQVAGEFEKEPDEDFRSEAVEVEGRYQFFEQGQYWLDSGLLLAYGHATHHDDADAIEAKLLLEKQWGQTLHRANIGIEQEIGPHSAGGPERVFLWSSRYRYNEHFEPGFEIQSNFGKANNHYNFNQQEHYAGPAVYGEIVPHLKYQAAYYFGVSDASSKGAARLQLEYEIYF